MEDYLQELLGHGIRPDGGLGSFEFESPFGGYDESGMRYKIIRKSFYKKNIALQDVLISDLSLAKSRALSTITFFSNICEILEEENPTVKYFKVVEKVLEIVENNAEWASGPYGIVIGVCREYVAVTGKAIKYIEGWLTSYISNAYLATGGGDLVVQIFIKKIDNETKLKNLVKTTSFELASNKESFTNIALSANVLTYSSYGYCIRTIIPSGTMQDGFKYSIKMKVGKSDNVTYIPLNIKTPFRRESYNFWFVRLIKITGKDNLEEMKVTRFKIDEKN